MMREALAQLNMCLLLGDYRERVLLLAVLLYIAWVTLCRKIQGLPPGPLNVPVFGNWLQVGDQITARNMAKLAERYGDIFMLKMGRRNVVIIGSPELAKEMLVTKGVEFGSRGSNIVFDIFTGSGKDLAIAAYGEHWRKCRRAVTVPFFTKPAVERWHTTWEREVDLLVQRLASRSLRPLANGKALQSTGGTGVELRDTLQFMIYNVVYSMTFGRRFESEDDPLYKQIKHYNDERGRLVQNLSYNYGDFHPFLQPFLWGYLRTCHEVKVARECLFKHFINEYLTKKERAKTTPSHKETFGIDSLLLAVRNGEMQEENVLYILENLNSAGIPTVSSSVEWAIAELIRNPHIQDHIYEELMDVIGVDGEITERDCCRLPYLLAVVKETMRLHTPVPFVVPHLNLAAEKLGGYHIPKGSKVLVNSWWLANNPKYWKEPHKFNPDRFVNGEESNVEMNGGSFKLLPFGHGRRQCPGILLALPLVQMTLAKLIQKYHILPPLSNDNDPTVNLCETYGQFLTLMAKTPKVILEKR